MKLLEPRRRLFYGLIVSARRDGGVLVIEDVVVPILKLLKAVRRLRPSRLCHLHRPRGTGERRD
jgi:D-lactate dehydrogenase (cytochrome)/glycolate oxidase